MSKKIYCIGGTAVDRKLKALTPLIDGTSNSVATNSHGGGSARNVAENLTHWTTNIFLHTIVGEDEDGIDLLSNIKEKGVDITQSIILKNARTANYYAVLNNDGEFHLALSDMAIFDQIPVSRFTQGFNIWEKGGVVLLDTNLTPEIIALAIRLAQDKSMRLCIEPVSMTKARKLPENLSGTYLLKANPKEAAVLTNMPVETIEQAQKAGIKLHETGVKNVVITLGKAGYVIVNKEESIFIGIEPIHDVVNVNGAGDAFMAGIIYGIQEEYTLCHACQWGAAAAAFTVSSPDTVARKLTSIQLQAFIHNQKIITGQQYEPIF